MAGLQEIAKKAGVRTETVQLIFETVLSEIAAGESVRIKGFGTFDRILYKGRTLVTPAVGEGKPISYPDSWVLKFRQSQIAKRRLNIVAKKQEREERRAAKAAAAESGETPPKKAKKSAEAEKQKAAKKNAKKGVKKTKGGSSDG